MSRRGTFGQWLDDYWVDVGLGICSLLMAVSGLLLSDEVARKITVTPAYQENLQLGAIIAMGLFGVGNIIFFCKNLSRQKRVSQLENELDAARSDRDVLVENVRSLVDGYLINLATGRLKFGQLPDQAADRITLYAHDPNGCFVPIGRFSFNPHYREIHRSTYSDKEGCIAAAWSNGSAFFNDFPNPCHDEPAYLDHQEGKGVPRSVAQALVMKSRVYFGYRVMDTRNRNPLAVVVVESTEPSHLDEKQLQRVFGDFERRFLSELIEVLQPHFSIPSDARKVGF